MNSFSQMPLDWAGWVSVPARVGVDVTGLMPPDSSLGGFPQMLLDWAGFFSALAQVSGSLVGLVFVALTFNAKVLGAGSNPMLAALAQQTFADFLLLLMISLVMLVPHTGAGNVGLILIFLSTIDTLRIIRTLLSLRSDLRKIASSWWIARRFLLSGLGHAQILWLGVELIRVGYESSFTGALLFSGTVVLLISGCRSAWLLLVHQAD